MKEERNNVSQTNINLKCMHTNVSANERQNCPFEKMERQELISHGPVGKRKMRGRKRQD